jgi:ATP-dependent DNA helicase RecG
MILSLIRENPRISARELSNKIDISARKVEENISKLKKKGLLQRMGPAKGGHWEILEK